MYDLSPLGVMNVVGFTGGCPEQWVCPFLDDSPTPRVWRATVTPV